MKQKILWTEVATLRRVVVVVAAVAALTAAASVLTTAVAAVSAARKSAGQREQGPQAMHPVVVVEWQTAVVAALVAGSSSTGVEAVADIGEPVAVAAVGFCVSLLARKAIVVQHPAKEQAHFHPA